MYVCIYVHTVVFHPDIKKAAIDIRCTAHGDVTLWWQMCVLCSNTNSVSKRDSQTTRSSSDQLSDIPKP